MSESKDAARFRWLVQHLRVERIEPDGWTCWLELPLIAFRSRTTSAVELIDLLRERFPIDEEERT
jgi:hypothetical protein